MWIIAERLFDDPVRVWLLGGDIIATFAVGFGIIWEHGPPEVRKIANWLVLGGIIAETFCSVWLFVHDGNISADQQSVIRSQNDKIIALERRLAPRIISETQKEAMVAKLKPFAGTEFDAATDMHDNEQTLLLSSLLDVLHKAGWKHVHWVYARGGITYGIGASGSPNIGDVATYDVEIQAPEEALARLQPIVEALVFALRGADIPAHAVVANETTTNNANQQLLHVIVGQRR